MNQYLNLDKPRTALITAGGTGGHIFPGLALSAEMKLRGWRVVWLGTKHGMEAKIIPEQGLEFEAIDFSGLRGKGWKALLTLPFRLSIAMYQCTKIIYQLKPHVVVGFGGYVTFPVCAIGKLFQRTVFLHEQNSVAGLSNRMLAHISNQVYTAFPNVIKNGIWAGNPLRENFMQQQEPSIRFQNREGPLKVLVIGGSLGAQFLNTFLPKVFEKISAFLPITITHQSGVTQVEALRTMYANTKLPVIVTPFIQDTATAFAEADLIICRAGASTVTEIAAVGAAAIYIPLPTAVDNHQYKNAMFMVNSNAGWVEQQAALTEEKMINLILSMDRKKLLGVANAAYKMRKIGAQQIIADACEEGVV